MPRESFTPEPTTESDRIEAMPSQIQLIQFGASGLGRADPEFRQDQFQVFLMQQRQAL